MFYKEDPSHVDISDITSVAFLGYCSPVLNGLLK